MQTPPLLCPTWLVLTHIPYSIQFNVVSKNLGCERMSFFLNEAANDLRDIMMPTIGAEKAKL